RAGVAAEAGQGSLPVAAGRRSDALARCAARSTVLRPGPTVPCGRRAPAALALTVLPCRSGAAPTSLPPALPRAESGASLRGESGHARTPHAVPSPAPSAGSLPGGDSPDRRADALPAAGGGGRPLPPLLFPLAPRLSLCGHGRR